MCSIPLPHTSDLLTVFALLGTQLQKLFLVSIAFKLVQKSNALNQLFKTAMSVPCSDLMCSC